LAAQVRVKPIHWFFTPAHAVFTRAEAFSNPGKDEAREGAADWFAFALTSRFVNDQLSPLISAVNH